MVEANSAEVVNTSPESFERDVLERSHDTLIVVDFWAEWCQPCRLLGPILESLANEYAGRFVLVKAETEKVPQAAAQFNVQGIPAVYAVLGGEVVDYFVGAQSLEQTRVWLERLLVVADVARAKSLEATAPAQAEALYRELVPKLPNEWEVPIGLARVLAAQGRDDEARAVLEKLERRGFLEPAAERVRASIELRSQKTPSIADCRAAVAAAPDNLAVATATGRIAGGRPRVRRGARRLPPNRAAGSSRRRRTGASVHGRHLPRPPRRQRAGPRVPAKAVVGALLGLGHGSIRTARSRLRVEGRVELANQRLDVGRRVVTVDRNSQAARVTHHMNVLARKRWCRRSESG